MRISPELADITNLVDAHITRHSRGIIDPSEMLNSRGSNCFGRLALVGAGLLESGTPQSQLQFLVSHNHAFTFGEGKRWFGHAALAIDSIDAVLVDATNRTWLRDLHSETNWLSRDIDGTVIDYDKVPQPIVEPIDWAALKDLDKLVGPPHISALRHQFAVYPFADGIDYYQASHSHYAGKTPMQAADYIRGYSDLIDLSVGESDSSANIAV